MGSLLSLLCPCCYKSAAHSIEHSEDESDKTVKPPVESKSPPPTIPSPSDPKINQPTNHPPAADHNDPIRMPSESPSREIEHPAVTQPSEGPPPHVVEPTVGPEAPLCNDSSPPSPQTPSVGDGGDSISTQFQRSTIEQPDAPPPAYTPSSHEMPKPQTSDPRLDATLVNPTNGQSRASVKSVPLQVVNPDDAPSVIAPSHTGGSPSPGGSAEPSVASAGIGPDGAIDPVTSLPAPSLSAEHATSTSSTSSSGTGEPHDLESSPNNIHSTATPKPPVTSQPTRWILPSTNDKLRLRVLVVGRAGVGKSSLISYAFGVGKESISHQERGKADITQPITPPENDRFILHDSMGFETGASEEFNIAKDFLKSRSGNKVALEEQVHVIWLCIRIPFAIPFAADTKSLIIAEGDQAFLKLAAEISVPIVVAFTQFDFLVMAVLKLGATPASALAQAESAFQDLCAEPLQTMSKGFRIPIQYQRMSGLDGTNPDEEALAQLIKKSQFIGDRHVEEEVWIVHAMAQRADVKAKLNTSFEIGMTQYWKYVAASAEVTVMNWTIAECLNTLHQKIVTSWNIYDPNELLRESQFSEQIKTLVQYVTLEVEQAKSMFPDVDFIHHWIGLAVPVAAFSGPAAVAVVLSAEFVKWITRVNQRKPETLRCFMAYIIDLTLVLEHAFGLVHLKPTPVALDRDKLDMAVQGYRNSSIMGEVHREIRRYASEVGIFDKDRLQEKMGELIRRFCSSSEAPGKK